MMQAYFQTKVGQKLVQAIKTGETFFTKVFERVYNVEVIGVQNNKLVVEVNSYDKVPSGFKSGGSDISYGEVTIENIDSKTKTEIMFEIIQKVDKQFINEYKVEAI